MEQLRCGQIIIFHIKNKIYDYAVTSRFLCSRGPYPNDQIFKDLGLNSYKFCSNSYGYEPDGGAWPSIRDRDYAALTRVVEALFPYCDDVTVDDKVVYSSSGESISIKLDSSASSKPESSIIDFESIVQIPKIKLIFI